MFRIYLLCIQVKGTEVFVNIFLAEPPSIPGSLHMLLIVFKGYCLHLCHYTCTYSLYSCILYRPCSNTRASYHSLPPSFGPLSLRRGQTLIVLPLSPRLSPTATLHIFTFVQNFFCCFLIPPLFLGVCIHAIQGRRPFY